MLIALLTSMRQATASRGYHSHLKIGGMPQRATLHLGSQALRGNRIHRAACAATFRTTAACGVLLPGSQALQTSALGVHARDAFLNRAGAALFVENNTCERIGEQHLADAGMRRTWRG
jgi:hypothetical protein